MQVRHLPRPAFAVHAADGVMVGYAAAGADDCFHGRRLDHLPLLEFSAGRDNAGEAVVGRGTIGIDMREAAAQLRTFTQRLAQCLTDLVPHMGIEGRPLVPGDGGFKRVTQEAEAVRHARIDANERIAPGTDRALAAGCLAGTIVDADGIIGNLATAGPRNLDRLANERTLRHIGGFETNDQQRLAAIEPGTLLCLSRIQQPQIGRPELRLHHLPGRIGRGHPVVKHHPGRCPIDGPFLQPQPALRNDAEDSFRAHYQAIGARPRATAGETPGLPPAAGREHPNALDEVVDVCVVGRVVAAGTGGHPAAHRRPREALRKVPQRETLRPQPVFQIRSEHACLDARSARRLIYFQYTMKMIEIDGDRAVCSFRHAHTPDNGRRPAIGDRGIAFAVTPGEGCFEFHIIARVRHRVRRRCEFTAQTRE